MTTPTKHNRKLRRTGRIATSPFAKVAVTSHHLSPSVNVDDQLSEYVVYLAVPGMERKDFSVSICQGKLMVAAAKREALHGATPCAQQQEFPEWKETYTLPKDADTLMTAAVYRNGELEIHIPKGKQDNSASPVEVFVY